MYGILQFLWTITNFQHLWTAESDQEAKSLTIQSNARHYRRCELAFNILRRHNWNINQPKKTTTLLIESKTNRFPLVRCCHWCRRGHCRENSVWSLVSIHYLVKTKRETQSSCVSQSVCVYIYICARESVCVCDTNKEQLGFARD